MRETHNVITYFCLPICLLGLSSAAGAIEIKIGQTYSDLPLDQSGTLTSAKPSGSHITLAHDINEQFRINLDYIDWDNTDASGRLKEISIDSNSYSATLSYFVDNFAISANYTYWESDYSESFNNVLTTQTSTDAPSYGLAVGYGIFLEDWIIEPSLSLQYNQWRYRDNPISNEHPKLKFFDNLDDETVVLSAMISASKIIQLSPETYLLTGGVIRWNEMFEPDSNPRPNTLGFAGRRSHSHTANDDFAELSFYITYDITQHWLVELDTSIAFLPNDNYPSIGWRVGYRF